MTKDYHHGRLHGGQGSICLQRSPRMTKPKHVKSRKVFTTFDGEISYTMRHKRGEKRSTSSKAMLQHCDLAKEKGVGMSRDDKGKKQV